MASLAEKVQAVRSNIDSISPSTVLLVNEILLPEEPQQANSRAKSASASTKGSRTLTANTRAKDTGTKTRTIESHNVLPVKERSILASEVINATLKSLSEAIKTQPSNSTYGQNTVQTGTSSDRNSSRRSSLVQAHLQVKNTDATSNWEGNNPNLRSIAECARLAFACLRNLEATKSRCINLQPMQLESGMSVLTGKLISLGMNDLAIKELRILKLRLLGKDEVNRKIAIKASNTITSGIPLIDLLDFGKLNSTGLNLGIVITTQLQTLRLISFCKKRKVIELALPLLQPSNSTSLTNHLLVASKLTEDPKETEKLVRQIRSFSEILLSLCPSVSIASDAIAIQSKVYPSPEFAFQYQTLAIHARYLWWHVAGHKGDASKDLFQTFLRCLSTFARRNQASPSEAYSLAIQSYGGLEEIKEMSYTSFYSESLDLVLAGIYKLISSLAKDANHIDTAIEWANKAFQLLNRFPQFLECLERPFKGHHADVDDLMNEISQARRAALNFILKQTSLSSTDEKASTGLIKLCESLIFLCPRLSHRYLNNSPDIKSTAQVERYEEKKRFIFKISIHAIDSALFLEKSFIGQGLSIWETVDPRLQDCLKLLDKFNFAFCEKTEQDATFIPSQSYYVRISNLYYTLFQNYWKSQKCKDDKSSIRALRRAVECIKARPLREKNAAFFTAKLERLAEVCKDTGRHEELLQTLYMIHDEMINDGTLSIVLGHVSTGSLKDAWNANRQTIMLGRTIHSIIKVQLKCAKSASQIVLYKTSLSLEERAIVMEHELEYLSKQPISNSSTTTELQHKILQELLQIYDQFNYPLRRARTHLKILSTNGGKNSQELQNAEFELEKTLVNGFTIDGTKDEGFSNYIDHYKTMVSISRELNKSQPCLERLVEGLAAWSLLASKCQSHEDLGVKVDDIAGLLAILHTIADWLQVHGFGNKRVTALHLISEITQVCEAIVNSDELVLNFMALGLQWLRLGYCGKAGLALEQAKTYAQRSDVSSYAHLRLQISTCEYLLSKGNLTEAESSLNKAQALYIQSEDHLPRSRCVSSLEQKIKINLLISDAYDIYSKVALHRGLSQNALSHGKQCVRLLRRAWSMIENYTSRNEQETNQTPSGEDENLASKLSNLSLSSPSISADSLESIQDYTSFWAIITPLFDSLCCLSSLFAHHGMFQETLYYAEQAHKLAKQIRSEVYLATSSNLLGSIWLRGGDFEKATNFLMEAKKCLPTIEKSKDLALLTYNFGKMHGLTGDIDAEIIAYNDALAILNNLTTMNYILSLEKPTNPVDEACKGVIKLCQQTKRTGRTKKTVMVSKISTRGKSATQAKSTTDTSQSVAIECPNLLALQSHILREKSRVLLLQKKYVDASALLQQAEFTFTSTDIINHGFALAKHLLIQSLDQIVSDPVYSILQDSTISFPAVLMASRYDRSGDKLTVNILSPTRKGINTRSTSGRLNANNHSSDSFFEKLRRAQDHLKEPLANALIVSPIATVYVMSHLLNTIAILLSTAKPLKGQIVAHPGLSSFFVEMARNLALKREQSAIKADPLAIHKLDESCWPQLKSTDLRGSRLEFNDDNLTHFGREYIDIIPKSWTVISISLSENQHELSLTKLQAYQSPFILRLPLGRNNSIDADEEVFGFEQGRAELREIVRLANESAHDAGNRTDRKSKLMWWEEREALDARMCALLTNIEKVWLGGFRGIFSQHVRRPDLLARFQRSFQNILDKHLPSRQKTKKRSSAPRVGLDSRILDLFVGLGDASDSECDFSEPLTDLLYFVVDVLQFHGELNAYAEVDFDMIVVETTDALRCYHEAIRASDFDDEPQHTILVLDKALHSFPWESLPCLDGLAVSRLPSLASLRERIICQQDHIRNDKSPANYVNREKGSYILNPGGDLKHTLSTFEGKLKSLDGWKGIINREPLEEEFRDFLQSTDLFLYFGHGSGSQYIRAREIKKLPSCAVTVLMGCSSGALVETGEFEPYGPPMNYVHAGSHALVATLWDVTDKDIDRFAQSTFEHWGLFSASTPCRSGLLDHQRSAGSAPKMSLVEAVARGRKSCTLRYLNAAAVCVYGVPVYLQD
ncbi:separin [Blumeria hordei DH14]|uniref:separase n=1 Tax=Blumeria graminis f. sp. hordei (strain DH14) TaxID=546991 RepID=N1JFH1_BLUG1|nr:separin [Blumeria hordei DH14]